MKRKFTAEECREYVFENEVKTTLGDPRRWMVDAYTIVEVDEKFYGIVWDKPLTESSGDNEFWNQECEELHQVKKIITKMVWEAI